MSGKPNYIGKLRHNLTDMATEYRHLAIEDENVGEILLKQGKFKHAVYFLVQAMEKHVRYKIFSLVNPTAEYFRERTRTHNLDELLNFLIEIVSSNAMVQDQVRNQLNKFVLGGIRFGKLHNDLRYPIFFTRRETYSLLEVSQTDAKIVLEKLQQLKTFLEEIDRLQRI